MNLKNTAISRYSGPLYAVFFQIFEGKVEIYIYTVYSALARDFLVNNSFNKLLYPLHNINLKLLIWSTITLSHLHAAAPTGFGLPHISPACHVSPPAVCVACPAGGLQHRRLEEKQAGLDRDAEGYGRPNWFTISALPSSRCA